MGKPSETGSPLYFLEGPTPSDAHYRLRSDENDVTGQKFKATSEAYVASVSLPSNSGSNWLC